jgi:hypothetical protein
VSAPAHDIRAIVAMLAARIEELARELLPAGRREGAEWRCGSVAGEAGQSLGIHLAGPRAGIWADFSASDPRMKGDALDLVAMCLFAGDKRQAVRWAREWLGLAASAGPWHTTRAAVPDKKARRAAELDAEGRTLKAKRLWLDAQPIAGSPAAAYLAARGIDLDALPRPPGALRFDPACWSSEHQAPMPAMLAAITRRGEHVATHRTYLAEERGTWRKAPLRAPKMVLGGFAGGLIALARGASGQPLARATEADTLAIAEGIEDALTLALHDPALRVVACVSLANMANLQLPDAMLDLVLVFDRDGENAAARAARERAVRTYLEQGRSVRELRPPEGHKDLNAWHQALRAVAA